MEQSGQVYATGEPAPIRRAYQIIGPRGARRCVVPDRRLGARADRVGQGDPLPAHDACGQRALWILALVAGMPKQEPIPALSVA